MDFIDLKTQQARIRGKIDARIAAVLDHGQYIMGPEVFELEEKLCEFVGVKHAIGVSSGTDSLLIALMALEIGPGDEVITTPYTWISTAEVIALVGAKPVFVDIEPDTWNIDPNLIEPAITERTKAIMPVGIYGQTANMTAINEIAARHGDIPVIEDAAQSFGATHHGKMSGSLSTIGSTSFFPSKPLGCYGDGGAIFTDDDELAEKMRWIRIHGQKEKHHHPVLGLTGRLDSIQAAILLEKLEIFPEEIGMRSAVGRSYSELLSGIPGIQCPRTKAENTNVFAQFTVLCEDRERIRDVLAFEEVPSVSYYEVPLHLQTVFEKFNYGKGSFEITERVAHQCLSLPMSPYLSDVDLQKVTGLVRAV
ncbi:MAG: DegT/DnrJ/EryC1/StrS family aminotransferase [Verrucomicrobiales bacterium]|nr:DegT/DnrJ/EryC1/StrS family aminotransferase [Verrucomicrobiales bacterium]